MSESNKASAELCAFLEAHGLGQYSEPMVAENIDLETLRDLDDADLRELGLSLGHRKTLIRALQNVAPASADPVQAGEDHRRQVTVLFCDLVGSTEMASQYDPEDMSDILERYHGFVSDVVEGLGGLNLGTQGDGVVACFGYPTASENDAERAVKAATRISEGVPKLVFGDRLTLHTRIGVATGRVFIRGKVTDSGALVGDILNLASRLQDEAPVDRVVVGLNTKRLIEKVADLDFLGDYILKGFDQTVPIWRVDAMHDRDILQERQEGHLHEGPAAVLGRDSEVRHIAELWQAAKSGRGSVLVLSGEPGIGKSSLVEAARDMARENGATIIRYFCTLGYENSALYPVRSQIARRIGMSDAPSQQDVVASLKSLPGCEEPEAMRLMADLLAVDPGDEVPALDVTATEQKTATYALLQEQLVSQAADGPLLVLFEDAHWADPSTLELLSAVVAQSIAPQPIMLIITQRPHVQLGLDAFKHVSRLDLTRLDEAQSREIVLRMMGDDICPPDILHTIIEAADGNPLFLEELSRSVAEQRAASNSSYHEIRVPITLEDSLRGRLDRLASGKGFVQTAAVFGRRFQTQSLCAVLDLEEASCQSAMVAPLDARILLPVTGAADQELMFRHALVQQAAYEGIARKQRQQLHAKIAELLLATRPGIAETEPETLARHFAGAGDYQQAITFLIAAGKIATAKAAQIEATNHYFAAIEYLAKLPEGRARDELEVLLRALLGAALMATRGFAAPEVYDAFARARELCHSLGDSPMYCACLYGLFTVSASRSNKEEALALAGEMLDTFGEMPVPSWVIATHFANGVARFFEGDLDRAEHHFDHAIDLYTPDQHALLVEQFGDNLAEFSMCYRHWLHLLRGELDQSTAILARAEDMANDLHNKNAQIRSIAFRMGRLMEIAAFENLTEIAPRVIELSTKQGYPYWACAGQIGLGWSMAVAGQAEGLEPILGSLGFFDMIGQSNPQTYWRSYLISAYVSLGQREAALDAARAALEMSRAGLDQAFEPVILLRQGEAHLLEPADPAAAEACFRQAREVAQGSGAHLYSFLNALALAELLMSQGRADEEDGALATDLQRISTDEDFAALTRARAILKQL